MFYTKGSFYNSLLIVSFLIIGNYARIYTNGIPDPEGILNSMQNLTEWVIKEEQIFQLAKSRHQKLKRELQILEVYIEDYKDSTEHAVTHALKPLKSLEERGKLVASSGILVYRMIYRYVKHLAELKQVLPEYDHHLEDILLQPETIEVNEINSDRNEKSVDSWPSWVDLNEAMQAFIHLKETMDHPLSRLPSILSPEIRVPVHLNAFHSVQIGLYALHKDYFSIAVEWLEFAFHQVTNKGDTSISPVLVNNYLAMAMKSHNVAFERLPEYDHTVFAHNVSLDYDERHKRRDLQIEHFAGMTESNFVTVNFWELCSGRNLQEPRALSKLHCYYEHLIHPVWYISPMKVEILSEDPPVIQIYDLIGEKMIQEILNRSQSHLSRSSVVGDGNVELNLKSRTSVNSWIEDDEIPQLTKKIEMITGLNVYGDKASEKLQVVEYVFGRYYAVHTDPLYARMEQVIPEDILIGDRVATLLFYLNDVGGGGYTPFANAGTFAPPIKGSAIFWYNLYRNGTMRDDTWHGACPVLYGHKIVANKWIRYNAQFNKFQCSLDPNE